MRFLFLLLTFSPVPAQALQEKYVSLETRPGVSQSFLLIEPAKPVASVILFAGGGGRIGVSPSGLRENGNFLVRTRQSFANQGFLVATVDAASDFQGSDGLAGSRSGEKRARDIEGVIVFLRQRANVPVWVVGNSRGTISAANVAARLGATGPDGVILSSTVTESSKRRPYNVFDVKLKAIHEPVLIVHHQSDGCSVSPYAGTKGVAKALKGASKVEVLTFTGGEPPRSGPCDAMSYHGFLGIEREVVQAMTNWIKRN